MTEAGWNPLCPHHFEDESAHDAYVREHGGCYLEGCKWKPDAWLPKQEDRDMGDDLIQRLRSEEGIKKWLFQKAADEIERLREELKVSNEFNAHNVKCAEAAEETNGREAMSDSTEDYRPKYGTLRDWKQRAEAAEAEVERLREGIAEYLQRAHPEDINNAIASPLYVLLAEQAGRQPTGTYRNVSRCPHKICTLRDESDG